MKKTLLHLILCLVYTCTIYGQDVKQQHKSIDNILTFYLLDSESGLSNNVVNSIEQDALGLIWIATTEGLNSYDGTQFTRYKKNFQDKNNSLITNNITQVKADKKGNLLVATDKGLNIYDTKTEKFKVLKYQNKQLDNPINCFLIGPNQELIIGAYNNGLGIPVIDKNQKIKYYGHQSNNANSLSSNKVSCMASQGDSIVWIGTADAGLNKFKLSSKTIRRIPYGKNKAISSEAINTIHTDVKGNVWIGTNKGIQVITTKRDTLSLKASSVPGKGLSDDIVLAFEEDNQGNMWIGTRNGGLNILNKSSLLSKKSSLSIKWFLPKGDGSSVFNRTVSSIKRDREGNMWIGTSTGLNFVNPKGEPIKHLYKTIDNPNGLGHDRIGAFAEKKDGKIWIGTDGGGLDLFDPKTGKFKHYTHQPNNPSSISNNYILSLHEDKKGNVWIGTYQGGLNKMNPDTGRCEHYLQGSTAQGSDVRVIFENTDGQIWVGTNRGGLYRYIEEQNKFTYIESIGKKDIRDIKKANDGSLWLATFEDGIINYNPINGKINSYYTGNTRNMPSNVFFCIYPLRNGEILAGTRYGGLIRLNPKTKTIVNFTESDGLSNNTVCSILMEDDNNFWLGTAEGISHYNLKTNTVENLNSHNNIQRSEFNFGAALKSKDGYLYFGGNKGFNQFHPQNLKSEFQKHRIVFKNLQVAYKKIPITPDNEDGILQQSISFQDHITLNYDQTLFSIDFGLLKFPKAQNINYSYKLEGYQNHWIDLKSASTVNLSNIPPGDYTLKVKATLGSGKEVSKQLSITITPPFWKTIPAYILYLILIGAALYSAVTYYSNHINLKNSLLFEKKQRQLEHDFNEERIRFFTSFSHELRTPLTLILGPIEDLTHEIQDKKQHDTMLLIKKNANYLLQSINKLLEFRKSEIGLSDLVISQYNLSSILEQLTEHYLLMAEKKGIALTLSLPEKEVMAWCDLEKIQIIVNNLLSNAFKHCKEKGSIKVNLSEDTDHFTITVADNGSGIDPKDINHIFEWYYQSKSLGRKKGSGIGLALSKSFAELHKGEIRVESKLNQGSVFTLSIPKDKSLFTSVPHKITPPDSEKMEISSLNAWSPTSIKMPEEKRETKVELHEERLVLLLIDDNRDILKYLEGLLEDDYDIIYAENGQEGIEKAIQYVPDLIISDIMMPHKSGIDLCAILKKEITTTHIPIILLSAKDNIESIKTGYEKGADDYIVKPFNSEILRSRIKNLLDGRQLLRNYFLGLEEPLQSFSKEQSKQLDKEKEFLRKLESVILEQIGDEKTNVNAIALGIGMSRTSLFRKIKALSGKNINEYVTMVKIKKAAALIKDENYTIMQATAEVGFSDIKYFRQLFKKQFGVVPSEYKKN